MSGKLRMARAVADDLGHEDFVIIARTDGSPDRRPGSDAWPGSSIERALRYFDTASRIWCGASSQRPARTCRVRRPGPPALPRSALRLHGRLVQWFNDPDPITFAQLGELGTSSCSSPSGAARLGARSRIFSRHAASRSSVHRSAAAGMGARRTCRARASLPIGVPYHQLVGESFGGSRLGSKFQESLRRSGRMIRTKAGRGAARLLMLEDGFGPGYAPESGGSSKSSSQPSADSSSSA